MRRDLAVLRQLLHTCPPAWRRLGLAILLGVGGAAATVGLLAGSGAVVLKAWQRPGLGAIAGLLAAVEVLAVLRAPLRYSERLASHDTAFRSLRHWRVWLYDRLEPLAPAGLAAWRSGDLLSRVVDDVDQLQDLYLRSLLPITVALAAAALAEVVVGLLLPGAALVVGASLVVALAVPPVLALAARRYQAEEAQLRGALSADVVDLVEGAAELLAFGTAHALERRIAAADRRLRAVHRRRALLDGASTAVVILCLGAAVVGVLAVGAAAVHQHQLEPVMLAVLPLAAIGAFDAIPPVTAAALHIGDVAAAGRRLLALEQVPVPVTDPPDPVPVAPGGVALDHARLRYGPDRPWALDGVSVAVDRRDRVALIGPNGAGKTSMVHALLRFWPLAEGRMRVGEVNAARAAQADVRQAMALVDQDADLFAGSIRDNVALGRPRADDDAVWEALRQAQLADWVHTLPHGLDTPVGEHGQQVSGGQRQRIAVARVLLRDAPVLLLDEPTTGLDEPAARRLVHEVLDAAGDRGVLLVTHRAAEAEAVGTVVRLNQGRITPPATDRPERPPAEPHRPDQRPAPPTDRPER